jgi:phage major head subunit gpT-like protein
MQLTPQALNFLFTEFKGDYDLGFAARKVLWPEVAERIPSKTESNTYGWMAEIPGFREWIGPRVFHNIAARSYQIINKDWENSFEISRNKIEDDQYGIYSKSSRLLGDAAARLWDDLVFEALQKGHLNTCYDGQFFFDTDHPIDLDNDAGGTYSNLITNKPITAVNLAGLQATMMGFKGESGKSLEVVPDLLVVPPALAMDAGLATSTPFASGGVALPNPLLQNTITGRPLRVLVIPRLDTEPDFYYILSTARLKPVVLQVRKEPEFIQRIDPSMDNVFHRKTFEYGADARGAAGYGLPFTAIRVKTTA